MVYVATMISKNRYLFYHENSRYVLCMIQSGMAAMTDGAAIADNIWRTIGFFCGLVYRLQFQYSKLGAGVFGHFDSEYESARQYAYKPINAAP